MTKQAQMGLTKACMGAGGVDGARAAIASGADPSKADFKGRTPFWIACGNGQADVARFLAEEVGVAAVTPDKALKAPLDAARENGHSEVVAWLEPYLAAGNGMGQPPGQASATAAATPAGSGSSEAAAGTAESGAGAPPAGDGSGASPEEAQRRLVAAAAKRDGKVAAAVKAVKEGAQPGLLDADGRSPFWLCCASGNHKLAAWLAEAQREHVDVRKPDNSGKAPLDVAATEELRAWLVTLIAVRDKEAQEATAGAGPSASEAPAASGDKAVEAADGGGATDTSGAAAPAEEAPTEASDAPDAAPLDPQAALLKACAETGSFEEAEKAVSSGADPGMPGMDGRTPLGVAMESGKVEVVAWIRGFLAGRSGIGSGP